MQSVSEQNGERELRAEIKIHEERFVELCDAIVAKQVRRDEDARRDLFAAEFRAKLASERLEESRERLRKYSLLHG